MIEYGYAYLLVMAVSLGSVSLLQNTTWGALRFGRLLTGGTAGYASSRILVSSTTFSSYVAFALGGGMGLGGFMMCLGLLSLLIVWGYNLWTSGYKEVVR